MIADSHIQFDLSGGIKPTTEQKAIYTEKEIERGGAEINKQLKTFLSKHSKIFEDLN